MQTKKKPIYKKLLFWELGILILVLAALVACLGMSAPPNWGATGPQLVKNPYGPEDFALSGEYLTCLGGESALGVDVSYWQGQIDWQQVKAAGVEFAMLRLGWRGTSEGKLFTDDYVRQNYEKATQAGIRVGGYFFSQAISQEEAVEEARYVLDLTEGWDIQMPIVFDWEYMGDEARTANVGSQQIMAYTKAFCDEIAAAGHTPMIYFNPRMISNGFDLTQMTDYHFWLAMYDREMDFPYRVDMWQYTASGSVPGISGKVDLNLYFPREDKK